MTTSGNLQISLFLRTAIEITQKQVLKSSLCFFFCGCVCKIFGKLLFVTWFLDVLGIVCQFIVYSHLFHCLIRLSCRGWSFGSPLSSENIYVHLFLFFSETSNALDEKKYGIENRFIWSSLLFVFQVIEFVQFKERLQRSSQYLVARVETPILQLKQKADNIEEEEVYHISF